MEYMRNGMLCLILMAFVPTSIAQIYKCETPDGPVFSDLECSSEAQLIELEDSSGLGVAVSQAERDAIVSNREQRDQQSAINRLNIQKNKALAKIDLQIRALTEQKQQANNNLAGATYSAGIDQQIAALRSARATTEASYQEQINYAILNDR